jgi:hypothetical protein
VTELAVELLTDVVGTVFEFLLHVPEFLLAVLLDACRWAAKRHRQR